MQMHEPAGRLWSVREIYQTLDKFAQLGKPIHITELAVASSGIGEDKHAQYVELLYKTLFSHPAAELITWLDLCDYGAWRPHSGLVRNDLTPKPAYNLLRKLIRGNWRTTFEGTTDSGGAVEFTGFHGKYDVYVVFRGRATKCRQIHLKKHEPNRFQVKLPPTSTK